MTLSLCFQVNGGSLAEKAGLQVADAVIKVNGQDVYSLRHKEAQDVIVKAGNSYEIVVSRSVQVDKFKRGRWFGPYTTSCIGSLLNAVLAINVCGNEERDGMIHGFIAGMRKDHQPMKCIIILETVSI